MEYSCSDWRRGSASPFWPVWRQEGHFSKGEAAEQKIIAVNKSLSLNRSYCTSGGAIPYWELGRRCGNPLYKQRFITTHSALMLEVERDAHDVRCLV